jgi:hypothetical protein
MHEITIEAAQITSAAEVLSTRSGYEDTPIELIAKILCQYLEELIEETLYDPEWFFRTDHRIWREIDKAQTLKASAQEVA